MTHNFNGEYKHSKDQIQRDSLNIRNDTCLDEFMYLMTKLNELS